MSFLVTEDDVPSFRPAVVPELFVRETPGGRPVNDPGNTDEAMLVEVARGDRSALAALYTRHVPMMFSLAARILRDPREAEDLVHDVFVEIWKTAGDFDPARGSVRSWMLLRVRSRAIDRVRSVYERRVELVTEDALEAPISAVQPQLVEERRVSGFLAELAAEHRQVLELGYFEGLSSPEIATVLGIPVGTVKSRVAAALSQLRRRLGVGSTQEVAT